LLQLRSGLLAEIHIVGAVNFLRDSLDFFNEGSSREYRGCTGGAGFGDSVDDFFGKLFRSGPPFANPSESALAMPRSAQ